MYINLAPGLVGAGGASFAELLRLAPPLGFESIDFPGARTEQEAADLAAQVADAGLRWGLFWQPCDFLVCDDDAFAAGLGKLRALLPIVRAAGCTRTYNHIFPGHDDLPYAENIARHVTRLRQLVDLLGDAGVSLGLEFIGASDKREAFRHPFIHTLAQTLELLDAVDARLGIVLDAFHWYASGGTLSDLALLGGRRVVNVHLNDAVAGRSPEAQRNGERAMPGATGVIDLPGLLAALRALGYEGPVTCEPFEPSRTRLRTLPTAGVLAEVAACMRPLVAASA